MNASTSNDFGERGMHEIFGLMTTAVRLWLKPMQRRAAFLLLISHLPKSVSELLRATKRRRAFK